MKDVRCFKPLWRIHNATYRRYAKGCLKKRIRRHVGKLWRILNLLRLRLRHFAGNILRALGLKR